MLADVVREDLVVVVVILFLGESRASVELGDYPGDEVPGKASSRPRSACLY